LFNCLINLQFTLGQVSKGTNQSISQSFSHNSRGTSGSNGRIWLERSWGICAAGFVCPCCHPANSLKVLTELTVQFSVDTQPHVTETFYGYVYIVEGRIVLVIN